MSVICAVWVRFVMCTLSLAALLSSPVSAQSVRVAVDIEDKETGGLFTSAFSAAFRNLGDVRVVALETRQILCSGELCYVTATFVPKQPVTARLFPWAGDCVERR